MVRAVLGSLLLLAGAGLLVAGAAGELRRLAPVAYQRVELGPGNPGFFRLDSRYPVDRLLRYSVDGEGDLFVAVFQGGDGNQHRALVYPPSPPGDELDAIRHEIWQKAAAAVREHAEPDALFVTWWDNGQRLYLLTGREVWARQPPAEGGSARDRAFLAEVAGGTARDGRVERLARWFAAPAQEGLEGLRAALPPGRPAYLLVTVDDLAHQGTMEALSGRDLGFDARVFPFTAGNLHGAVPAVKEWARAGGGDGYLVQELPGGRILAWRAGPAAAESLLGRLLPFTTSLARPLPGLDLVYQSGWGGYLSVYRLTGGD